MGLWIPNDTPSAYDSSLLLQAEALQVAQRRWEDEARAQQAELSKERVTLASARAVLDAAMENIKVEKAALGEERARLAAEVSRWQAEAEAEGARLAAETEALQTDRERFREELSAVQSTVEGREEAVQVRPCRRGANSSQVGISQHHPCPPHRAGPNQQGHSRVAGSGAKARR